MSHVFHQLYYHFVWATHERAPVLVPELRPDVLRIQAEEIAQRGGILIRQNCVADHMHLLVRLTPSILISDFIGQVKGGGCYRFNHEANSKLRLRREAERSLPRRTGCQPVRKGRGQAGSLSYGGKVSITARLKWQEGYAVLTLREEEVEKVARYIDNQERLHQQRKLSRILETLAEM